IAVLSSCKGKGLASELLAYAYEKARARGWGNIRIDTHEDNRSMRRLLAKNGFVQCGNVMVGKFKEPRIAYQKTL
ncbi:MAG: GNAT family N-acetyltransferase, partial [Solobacterium sp.]|nr:GNAT family N-acetyltransferase [Solobacterium sp.]